MAWYCVLYEQRKDLGRHPLPFSAFLAYLVVCTFLLTGVSFSKYVTRSNAADSARVAKGIVTVGSTSNKILEVRDESPDTHYPRFTFDVTNNNSEVAIGYDIVVKFNQLLPDGVLWGLDGNFSYNAEVTGANEYTFRNAGTFEAGKYVTRSHTLMFVIGENNGLDRFPDVGTHTYNIDISIESHQID